MSSIFNSVQTVEHAYSRHNLSHTNKFNCDMGQLVPSLILEMLPNDYIRINEQHVIRTMPLTVPLFSNYRVDYDFFFVPYRLVYEDWTKFIIRGDKGTTDYIKPYLDERLIRATDLMSGSLLDFLGFPSLDVNNPLPSTETYTYPLGLNIEAMPINAYNIIYNEYYRDENLIPEVYIAKKSGLEDNAGSALAQYHEQLQQDFPDYPPELLYIAQIRQRAYRKDYFTSALPFAQKGPQISVSSSEISGGTVPVNFFTTLDNPQLSGLVNARWQPFTSPGPHPGGYQNPLHAYLQSSDETKYVQGYVNLDGLQQSVMSISDLRTGFALQKWYELNARSGSGRYTEYLLGHFGAMNPDLSLQRPEFLGRFTSYVNVSDIEQTSQTTAESPQGNLSGKGLGYGESDYQIEYNPKEFGYIICITSIIPKIEYYKGLPKLWSRSDCFDYYDPLFDHLSEQSIKNKELFFDFDIQNKDNRNDDDFGYTPRFAEYRYHPDEVHGDFRSNVDLKLWLGTRQDINKDTQLNQQFIEVRPYEQQLNYPFVYVGSPNAPAKPFLVYTSFLIDSLRPMSKYATPV